MEQQGFWDSSALTALFVPEAISATAKSMARQLRPIVWWGAAVEVRSALARLRRQTELSEAQWQFAVDQLTTAREGWREIFPREEIRVSAVSLLDRYPLRAADSFQLAAALAWCDGTPDTRRFICQDVRLSIAAADAGFDVVRF